MLVRMIHSHSYMPNFTRRLRKDEEPEYRSAINEAKRYLGIKNISMIIHGSCYPAGGQFDGGIGSPFSKQAEELIKFEKLHGFNANQLGPMGEVTRGNISPYSGTVFAKNHLFINLKELTTQKYGNILSPQTYRNVILQNSQKENQGTNYTFSEFFEAFEIYDIALKEAYKNFKLKLNIGDKTLQNLNKEFEKFKAQKGEESLQEGLFQVLTRMYGTMDTSVWEKDVDRNLITLLRKRDPKAIERYNQLTSRYKNDIDTFIFGQFIADKQMKENKEFREDLDFVYINDLLVGFSPSEEWIHRDAFLEGFKLGCPDGGKLGPQLWEIPVLDPNKLFNQDGTLGPAGKLLKNKIESAFESCENVRIDHALGLVDPYIYDKRSVSITNGYLDRSKFYANNLSNLPHLDPNGNYKKILERIVLPLLKKHDLKPEDAIWEDLGTQTETFKNIYYAQNKLPGITQLEWCRGENSPHNNTALIGSHDSDPAIKMIKKDWIRNHDAWNVDYLSGYLNSDPTREKDRAKFKQKIITNPMEQVKAKFMELFTSANNIQISFADFFGIDKTYNIGGVESNNNWKLRLNSNYEDTYYDNLESDFPTALNMPEILKGAVQAKIDLEVVQASKDCPEDTEVFRRDLHKNMAPLLASLDKFANILKEKTEQPEEEEHINITA